MISLNPPSSVGIHVEDFHLPALALGVVLVHFIEVAGEQCGLVAAGAGADLHDAAAAVGVLAADGHVEQLVPAGFALGLQLGQFGLGQLAHLRVGALEHLRGFGDLGVELLEAAILGGQLGQRAVLAGDHRHSRRIGQHLGIDELPFQFLEAGEGLFQLIAQHGQVAGPSHGPRPLLG